MYKDEIEKRKLRIADALCRNIKSSIADDIGKIIAFAEQRAEDRPKLKPVDLSVLIESGIDCEFSKDASFEYFHIDKLNALAETQSDNYPSFIRSRTMTRMLCCRPRMNYVHAWQGGVCPLPEGLVVKVYTRNGIDSLRETYTTDYWGHRDNADRAWDIIGFEVLSLADGYCWP